jgi:hypothetical protein
MRRLIRISSLLLLGGLLAGSGAGCCCKQGYVLHGDWNLEVNRRPCHTACCAGGCGGGDEEDAAVTAGPAVAVAPPGQGRGGLIGPGRFHPVPTRPVFGQRPEQLAVPVSAPGAEPTLMTPDPEDIPIPLDADQAPPADSARQSPAARSRIRMSGFSR